MNNYLDFITDEDFERCARHVLKGYKEENEKLKEKLSQLKSKPILDMLMDDKNTIDEFKLLFDLYGDKTTLKEWKEKETLRQSDKTVNNYIGEFHQKILGCVNGWADLDTGDESEIDLKKEDNSIFVEIKNKHNTMNSSSSKTCREKLESIIQNHPNATVYWAYIVSKKYKTVDRIWKKKNFKDNEQIREISGDKLYEIVTGDFNALEKTFNALRKFLKDNISDYSISLEDDGIIDNFKDNVFPQKE